MAASISDNYGAPMSVAVIGGVNIDIRGRPFRALIPADSNPGSVRTSIGGVGLNIAHNISLLGLGVTMLTALGDDHNASLVETVCSESGIDLRGALRVPGAATSSYLFISDERGDMALAVSDMEIYDKITPAVIEDWLPVINSSALAVFDTNIPAESVAHLARKAAVPLLADPVSCTKAAKLFPVLSKLHTLKPNLLEAELLSGINITDERTLHAAADALLATGLQRVFISLGERGVLAAQGEERLFLPGIPGVMRNTTGCGDAFLAGLALAVAQGESLKQSALFGLAAASLTMESEETVNPDISRRALIERLKEFKNRK